MPRQDDDGRHSGFSPDRHVGSGTLPCAGTASLVAPAVVVWYTLGDVAQRFDLDLLGDEDVFEVDAQAAHLFKHPHLGVDDIYDVWASDPLFYPAIPPAHWLMCAEVAGRVLVVPLAPARMAILAGADPLAATRRALSWQPSTGETDDEASDDPRRGIRLLRPA